MWSPCLVSASRVCATAPTPEAVTRHSSRPCISASSSSSWRVVGFEAAGVEKAGPLAAQIALGLCQSIEFELDALVDRRPPPRWLSAASVDRRRMIDSGGFLHAVMSVNRSAGRAGNLSRNAKFRAEVGQTRRGRIERLISLGDAKPHDGELRRLGIERRQRDRGHPRLGQCPLRELDVTGRQQPAEVEQLKERALRGRQLEARAGERGAQTIALRLEEGRPARVRSAASPPGKRRWRAATDSRC